MTLTEVAEKFGDIKVPFTHYYKYSFYYEYEDAFVKIKGSYGGDHNEIYRHEVDANSSISIHSLDYELSEFKIIDKFTNEVLLEKTNDYW